ncbi:MAG: prepilin-type N-terminal cleavage/methylation domain-containing protein [Acidimicrobiia bacterium]
MSAEGRIVVAFGRATTGIARRVRQEAGFTLIEVLLSAVMLAIISAPISAILSQGAVIGKLARERTGASQLAQAQIEAVRALAYYQVGTSGGNPAGSVVASNSALLPDGEAVTITRKITWVADPIPTAFVTNADYKKVVVTITRSSDNHVLATDTTLVSSASAPPYHGSSWVQIKRTVIDAVTALPLPGASVNITGGPDTNPVLNRTDTADGAGVVLFPALNSAASGTPVYTLATTLAGYNVFPDDISTGSPSSIASTPGLNSTGTIRMYKGTSLTVNVQTSGGLAYTSGATISLDSSRCGKQTVSIPSGQSSVTLTTCDYTASMASIPMPPNVLGQTPLDDKYYVTAWSTNNLTGNWSTGTAVTVSSNYPTTLTQSVNVKMVSATFPYNATYTSSLQKNLVVTVKKAGVNDTNARVEVTGAPTGISPGIALFGVTNGSGQVTFTVPVVVASTTFTVNANELGVIKGSATQALQQSSVASTSLTVNIS